MTELRQVKITGSDGESVDAFGRWRTSQPRVLFNSKQIFENQPLFWDDAETSGSGTTSSHSVVESATGATANTITGGTTLACGFTKSSVQITDFIETYLNLGTALDGTVDEMVLAVRPLSSNADIQASLTWVEVN